MFVFFLEKKTMKRADVINFATGLYICPRNIWSIVGVEHCHNIGDKPK